MNNSIPKDLWRQQLWRTFKSAHSFIRKSYDLMSPTQEVTVTASLATISVIIADICGRKVDELC
jgi:hypothetical protein